MRFYPTSAGEREDGSSDLEGEAGLILETISADRRATRIWVECPNGGKTSSMKWLFLWKKQPLAGRRGSPTEKTEKLRKSLLKFHEAFLLERSSGCLPEPRAIPKCG